MTFSKLECLHGLINIEHPGMWLRKSIMGKYISKSHIENITYRFELMYFFISSVTAISKIPGFAVNVI